MITYPYGGTEDQDVKRIVHTLDIIKTRCEVCGQIETSETWVSDSPHAGWGHGDMPTSPYEHIYDSDTFVITDRIVSECSSCSDKRERAHICSLIPGLSREVPSRQRAAVGWFESHTEINPADYEVVHASAGYNPERFGRSGVKIGYTSSKRHGYCVDACYLVRKDSKK